MVRVDPAPELRVPERPRPDHLIDRHREWIAASTAAPYRKRRRARRFRAASLVFPAAVGLAAAAVLLAVMLATGGDDSTAPLQDQLIPGGSGSGAVMVKSPAAEQLPRSPGGGGTAP
ncbi:MAG TPA: hypothetical protein VGR37_18605 [Longimicrobiaceae bacterium]|nr:hypothetical protein [Longimicrobiaceae bacterium]